MPKPCPTPTPQVYLELQQAFDHFNRTLYDNTLPSCLITLTQKKRSRGYFAADRYVHANGQVVHELAMNARYFAPQPIEQTLSTLVHEMSHLWQHEFGTPGRRGYHNREWAEHLKSIGLHPSHTGEIGGREVGEQMTHYLLPEGRYLVACRALLSEDFQLHWFDRLLPQIRAAAPASSATPGEVTTPPLDLSPPPSLPEGSLHVPETTDRSNRQKYTCPTCASSIWGRPRLRAACVDCGQPFVPVSLHAGS